MRDVNLNQPPSRIVSLVPSITELLSDLGLDDSIVGITKFCIHPDHLFRSKQHAGGTKNIDIEKIRALQPDLIIANKEENTKEDIEVLAAEFPVWISDVATLGDACEMISELGIVTGTEEKAESMVAEINDQFDMIQQSKFISALYLIWKNPYMAAGGGTFIDDMLHRCGLNNVLSEKSRYPEFTEAELKELQPEVVFLSSEPYPFREKHIAELSEYFPSANILTVDGTYFSWYGSRLRKAPEYFNTLLKTIRFSKKQSPLHED